MSDRFDPDARDRAGAVRYLEERAKQVSIDGFQPEPGLEPLVAGGDEWGVRGFALGPDGARHQAVYVYAPFRGRGLLSAMLARDAIPVVTVPDCNLERFLAERQVPHTVVARITTTREYGAIAAHYGARAARRSGVPLMHHIDEGLAILRRLAAGERAMRAFCLHPLVQQDDALAAAYPRLAELTTDLAVLALAVEYRNVANATLSRRAIASAAEIALSPLAEVNAMLVADKVQNRKDFVRHHRGRHPRSAELDRYFRLWLERLDISEAQFSRWAIELQRGFA
jgi:hypothetical protein